jgi:glycosyltransferase involved in cell wall biosynthesis
VIENGYDEDTFSGVEASARRAGSLQANRVTFLHSGIVYPSERDPTRLFEALRQLKDEGLFAKRGIVVRFRAPVHDVLLRNLAIKCAVEDLVEIVPAVPYRQALDEMLRADVLLVLQAANCNEQIPAKLYEYLRAGRPILALTDPAGDTAGVLKRAGVDSVAALDSRDAIAKSIKLTLEQIDTGRAMLPTVESVAAASRRARSRELAKQLDEVVQV